MSGLVRNPAAGQPVEHLSAVVFLFDRQGAFVTSAKADVDFPKLGAGDESPFAVSLDAPATVARYRVSFRTDEGVVPHIDRRGAAARGRGRAAGQRAAEMRTSQGPRRVSGILGHEVGVRTRVARSRPGLGSALARGVRSARSRKARTASASRAVSS